MIDLKNKFPADIAEELTALDKNSRNVSFLQLPKSMKVDVFSLLETQIQEEIVKSLGEEELAYILNNLYPDDRTEFLDNIPDELIKYSINLLNEKERQVALNLLGYEKDSIARLMTPNYVQIKEFFSVDDVLRHIRRFGRKAETLNYIYVVDDNNVLIDDLRIGELLLVKPETLISELVDNNFAAMLTTTPIENALDIFKKYDRAALPIITEAGVLVGIVTADDILDEVTDMATEDIQKFGGLEELDVSYTQTPFMEMVKKRSGWLVLLFLGETFTATAMGHYDAEIEKAVVLALFVPLIISSGGNSGSQAASLIIRAMALGELKVRDWWYVMKKEILSGLVLGSILGLVGFSRIFVWQRAGFYDYGEHWPFIGLSVALSLVFVVLWGTISGSLIPFVLKAFKLDPATASAPFVATLVDVSGLVIYFTIASIILAGKIL